MTGRRDAVNRQIRVQQPQAWPLMVASVLMVLFVAGCSSSSHDGHQLGSISNIEADHRLDPEAHTLSSQVTLTWQPATVDTFFYLLHNGLAIGEARAEGAVSQGELLMLAEGDAISASLTGHAPDDQIVSGDHLALYALPVSAGAEGGPVTLHFTYDGVIHDDVEVPEFSRWEIADETSGLIDSKGAFLLPSTGYYPSLPVLYDLSTFSTTLHYPDEWEGLVEGNRTARDTGMSAYESPHQLDGAHIVAGPYTLEERPMGDITVAMLHFDQGEELVDRYLTHSTRYLAMYEERLGEYPFDRFTVVENWFPTGYGMPTFTLLGTDVLALPFIVYTSLGHEVLHNWWGNGVLVDYENGNWCEGLTVYQADYEYAQARNPVGKRQYRMDLLRDYSDYVVRGDDEDFPLRDFTSRTTAGSRTIGYGKSMMVFHMAMQRIGSEAFEAALRDVYDTHKFTVTRWSDFFDSIAELGGVPRAEFDAFETQWIDRGGAPALSVQHPSATAKGDGTGYMVEFDVLQTQNGDPFTFDLSVRLTFSSDSSSDHVLRNVNGEMYHARVPSSEKPVRIQVDPDFDVFRVIDPVEAPPTLSGFFGSEQVTAVVPASSDPMSGAYATLAQELLGKVELTVVEAGTVSEDDLDGLAVVWMGSGQDTRPVRQAALSEEEAGNNAGLALVWTSRSPKDPTVVQAHIWADDAAAMGSLARKLPHYGKYSYLAFRSGQNIGKGQWEVTESPLIVALP